MRNVTVSLCLFSGKAGPACIRDFTADRGSEGAWWSLSSSGHTHPPLLLNPPTEAGEVVVAP